MAMVATTTAPPPPPPSLLNQDSLSHIDLSTLSQSELHSLSLCSTSPSPSTFPSPLLPPKIDRSQFNESAGSRRQTYSRPSISAGHRRRVAGLLPTPKLPPIPADDPERVENRYIINHLKQFLNQDPRFDRFDLTLTLPSISSISIAGDNNNNNNNNEKVSFGNGKRKRGRKPKLKALHLEEDYRKLEIVNKNGVVVDLEKLANAEDPFGEELRRRTVGMESEEALLGFMRELGGQWGSRRKKRKIVDAAAFGDALPVGWKLLLGIRRRDGRASIYCRRYISPTGQHFVSCKEAASYLQSFFGLRDAQWPSSQMVENIQQDYRLTSETQLVAVTQKDEDRRQEVISSSTAARVPISSEQPKEATLLGMDNLADVQIRDLFECHKCSMTFDEKDTYLQHLLSFHQRTTRRYRLGSSVGDGVIIKDGKYECQFCHKVFLERRRYNGHVGIHVRNYVRRVEEVPGTTPLPMRIESPTRDDVPSRISKMDALIEIAQNSILETSTVRPNNEPNGGSTPNQLNVVSTQEIPASNFNNDTNLGSPLSGPEMDDDSSDRTLDQDLNQLDGEHISTAENMEKTTDEVVDSKMDCCLGAMTVLPDKDQNANTNEAFCKKDSLAFVNNENDISGVEQEGVPEGHLVAQFENQIICEARDNINLSCTSTLDHPKPCEVNNNIELKVGVGGINEGPSKNVVMEIVQQTSEENILQHGVSDSPMSPEQLLQKFSTFNATSDKGDQLHSVDQRHDNLTGFEELRLDEIEPLKYSTATGQESLSLQEVPMDLTYSVDMEREYASSVQFESEEVMLNMGGRHQLTTVCVWCGVEFNHEAVDAELQSDSVGFMCPTCKAKISGQYISGSPMTSHRL